MTHSRRLAYHLTLLGLCGWLGACASDNSNVGNSGFFGTNNSPVVANFPSKSGTIQIDNSERFIAVLNASTIESTGSISFFQVKDANGNDNFVKVGQVAVGNHPESVSVLPDGTRAYVSNGADNSVSVIDLTQMRVMATIPVGGEPRGTALTPLGTRLYVANHSDGTLSVIDTSNNTVINTVTLANNGVTINNPFGVTITNDRDGDDGDETIFVTEFWGRQRAGKGPNDTETFDDGKEGRVARINTANNTVTGISTIAPMASGFTQDRTAFTSPPAAKPTYQVTTNINAFPSTAYFNQLHSLAIDPDSPSRMYLTSIAASPEPPVNFANNVQACIGALSTSDGSELTALKTNLNNLVKVETDPNQALDASTSLTRLFMADTVDMAVRNKVVVFVSRAGSYLLKGTVAADGTISLNNSATVPAVRVATGNIPNGVVMNSDGTRAYVNNTVDRSFTAVNLNTGTRVVGDVATADLPAPGTIAHNAIIGELVFFTGLGVSPNGLVGQNVRSLDTHPFRNRASNNNWSSCASCHHQGLMDQVTWSFGTGPRNTISMDGSFSKSNPAHQRVFNLNAVMGSVTDFNNNSRGVQGGKGFTVGGDADAATVYAHGPSAGISQALDLMTLWMQAGIRTFNAPTNLSQTAINNGRAAFTALNCNQCHGGDQWTSSQVRWNRPLFPNNASFTPLDRRVQNIANNPVLQSFDANPGTGVFVDPPSPNGTIPIVTHFPNNIATSGTADTFDPANPLEIRGAGVTLGAASVGAAGSFNPPSLLGLAHSAPYGHHGRAQTIEQVFTTIASGGLGHPTNGATPQQLSDLAVFLKSIDSRTAPVTNPFASAKQINGQ